MVYGHKRQSVYLLIAEIQELVKLDATIRKRTEGAPFLEIGSDLGVCDG